MKRLISVLISCLLLLSSCGSDVQNTKEQRKNKILTYESVIQNIDPTLNIFTHTKELQNGDFIILYNVISNSGATYTIQFEIMPKKTKLSITFDEANSHWSDESSRLFYTFIYCLSNNNLNLQKIADSIGTMNVGDSKRLNFRTFVDWDECGSLKYFETQFE